MRLDRLLFLLLQVAWALAIQAIAGRLLATLPFAATLLAAPRNRRRWTRWLGASRALHRTFFPALGAAVAVALLFHLIPLPRLPAPEPLPFGFPGLATAAGGAATAGALALVAAGRREAAGRLRPARRLARPAGFLLAAGAATTALGRLIAVAVEVAGPGPDGFDLAGALLAGGAAVLGLLGALSGKPRPAAGFAAGLWILATGAFVLSRSAFGPVVL